MPVAYTPGLKITEDTILRKERRLPIKGEVLVEAGTLVEPETVVARAMVEGSLHSLKAAEQLGISPSELPGFLKKQVGERVEKGELLAETRGLFGLFKTECRAPVEGTIEHISPTSGYVGIRQPPRRIEIRGYLRGKVVEILSGEGAVIESRAAFVQGIFGVGGERFGPLRITCRETGEILTDEQLSEEMRGGVVVCGGTVSPSALARAAEIGVAGLIVGGLPDESLRKFVGYDIGVAITGQEKVPFTLILTEGFGEISMAERTFRLLQSLACPEHSRGEGKTASINGATQIRAGVIRPEIIVPRENGAPGIVGAHGRAPLLAPGVRVRVIREPYFGRLAQVIELPSELREIETGAKVRVAVVRMENGEEAVVPRANLEMILATASPPTPYGGQE